MNRPGFAPNAQRVLFFLFLVNLLNYLDRQVLYAVLPLIKTDLGLSDAQLGALASAFMLVYMCAAPVVAALAVNADRTRWMAAGLLTWTVATLSAGFSRGFPSLMASRALVGVGESSFGAMSPSFAAEHFPPSHQGRALAILSMAIPVGSALGYLFGGVMGPYAGWRSPFFIAGAVGLPLAFFLLRLKDPRPVLPKEGVEKQDLKKTLPALLKNRTFMLDTLALAAMTFTLGGLAVWMPSFLNRTWSLSLEKAGLLFGGITVVTGVAGSLTGGWLGDKWSARRSDAYLLISALGLFASVPFACLALTSRSLPVCLAALSLAEFFIFLNTGPLNAVIAMVTPLESRTLAFGTNIFLIHALGDAVSPLLIGAASDAFGLTKALLGAVFMLVAAGLFCLIGMKTFDDDFILLKKKYG